MSSPPPASNVERRLLVLGSSDTTGASLSDPRTQSWPYLLRGALAERGGPVDVTVRRFVPHVPGAGRYFDEQLAAYPSDWVILQATAYSVVHLTVPYRVARVLGASGGRTAEEWVRRFDRFTRRTGAGGLNRGVHRLGRRILPPAAQSRYRPLVDTYLQAITSLSRLESTWTAVVGTGVPQASVVRETPRIVDLVESFNHELSAAAGRHHMPWIDHDAAIKDSVEPDALFVDHVHKGPEWHRRVATDLLVALGQAE